MKKFSVAVCFLLLLSGTLCAGEYDPQNTVLALNMAVVSINRILNTQDRVILEWEYDNIINRLALGNIESDPEIIGLYQELLNLINGKKLRQEDSEKLRESYVRRQKEAYYRAMYEGFASLTLVPTDNMQAITTTSKDESGYTVGGEAQVSVTSLTGRLSGYFSKTGRLSGYFSKREAHTLTAQDPFLPLLGWVGNISISSVSSIGMSYYGYQAERELIRNEIDGELWRLQREEIESCHKLQSKLLNSSWKLLRQYGLPDAYRLTENTLSKFFRAMDTNNTQDRLKMLKIIERDFMAYPPYWFYRARTAFDAGDMQECDSCFEKFNEVWRPVLRRDCYKAEAAKYQVNRIVHTAEPTQEILDEIRALADTIQEYAPEDDWSSNIFAGLLYFALRDREKAIACVEENILFEYEKDISVAVLEEMNRGAADFTFSDIAKSLRKTELEYQRSKYLASIKDSELSSILTKYFASCDIEAFAGFECLMKEDFAESKQHFSRMEEYCDGLYILGAMYAKGLEVEKDYKRASEYYWKAAMLGHLQSQWELGNLYYDGGPNLKRNYMEAYKWYQVIILVGESEPDSVGDYALVSVYNIMTLGGSWNWWLNWMDEGGIRRSAKENIWHMQGAGWFYLAKGTKEEREKALTDAIIIRDSIPVRQAYWKQ